MFRSVLLMLAGAVAMPAQMTVVPQRIAGLPPAEWPIGDGGPATSALLTPTALAWDRSGNLLIADVRNNRIRRLMTDGTIATAWTLSPQTDSVYSMVVDSKGNLYASAYQNEQPALLELTPNGSVTQIQGVGSMEVAPGLAMDAADNLYITDQGGAGGGFVWKRSPSGAVQKIAGSGAGGFPGNSGPALQVTLGGPHALAVDWSGNLLIADWSGLLRLNPNGTLTRFV